jgi:hypothetical protein
VFIIQKAVLLEAIELVMRMDILELMQVAVMVQTPLKQYKHINFQELHKCRVLSEIKLQDQLK